jgi:serine/threonine protein kinase/Flp pilus assembly protein TadD
MTNAIHVQSRSASRTDSIQAELVEQYLQRLQAGETVDLTDFAAQYPEHVDALRELLPALQMMADLSGSATRDRSGSPLSNASSDPELGVVGDFRILREVGRGGMGVVYEAEQLSLHRRVALKVLPLAGGLDPRQLQRFKTEAQAAALLHHTNIVPIHAVGCERGVHFYAMQFIDGQTLAQLINERRASEKPPTTECGPSEFGSPARTPAAHSAVPTPSCRTREVFHTAAMLGIQAALALDHAHVHGVIHRDIKPANLLLDASGCLWVTDFGLARLHDDNDLTMTGDLLGTLRYMSPEQAQARRGYLDHRTDIYSLGATLYEFLTLHRAIEGGDRQEILRKIAQEEPAAPRTVNVAIPRELETIVQKAMNKEPESRYATARELADDLERFLRDEPILARRSTLLQRARRWARRHRPVMVSAAVALLAALAVLAGSVGWIMRDRAARHAKWTSDIEAALKDGQRFQKEGLWPYAQAAARRAEGLLQDGMAEPALAERVRSLLRNCAEQEADVRLVAGIEAIRLRQAGVKDDGFLLNRSRAEYQEAFGTYGLRSDVTTPEQAAALVRRRPPSVRSILLAALDHWSILANSENAREAGWLRQLLSAADSDPWRQGVRAAREKNDRQEMEELAREVDTAVQPPEALFVLELGLRELGAREAGLALLRRAQQAFPGDFWINHDLGTALGGCQPPQNEEAIRFLTVAVALRPDSAGLRLDLSKTLGRAERLDDALVACRQAIGLKPDFSMAHLDLGVLLARKGHLDEAVAACRRACELNPDYGHAYYDLGLFLYRMGRVDEALAPFRRAVDLMPDESEAHSKLGRVLADKGQLAEAAAAWRRASRLKPDDGDACYNLGTLLINMGRADKALAPLRRAIGLMPDHAESHCNLGLALQRQGEYTQALIAFERGHKLGSRRKDWRYPSAEWVNQCRRKIELDGRLDSVLREEAQPADAHERDSYAHLCYEKKRYVAAARFFSQVLTAGSISADDLENSHRYQAACAAALAGCGRGDDAGQLDEKERIRWRKQALDWLRAELRARGELPPVSNRVERQRLQGWLRSWQSDEALAGLRDATTVAHLSAAEQESWNQLWADVRALLAK